jgi:dUTP pyrophosphatase
MTTKDGGWTVEMKVLDKRIHVWGMPAYQSAMAAALDLYACLDAPLELAAQAPAVLIPSGIAIHMARPDIAAIILPRSGAGHRKGLVLGNTAGLIDGDYTGQIQISAWNRNAAGSPPIVIEPGERVAQMMFVPVLRPALALVETFSQASARGAGGFGSTG